MKPSRSGLVLLELLLAIAVVGLITVAGFRAFSSLGEVIHRRTLMEVEAARIGAFESTIRRAWDQRLAHRFQAGPWLVIQGESSEASGWIRLESIRLKTVRHDGLISWFEHTNGSGDAIEEGRILVNAEALGEWLGGSAPPLIHFRFPGAVAEQNQNGFAVWDLWP